MKFLLAGGIAAFFAAIGGLLFMPHSFGQSQAAPIPDFAAAVQAGLQSLATNPGAGLRQQEIQSQEYRSTWDEFGINALIDGSASSTEIDHLITQDIARSVEAAQNYDQQEADYLQAEQITPEQVQAAEDSAGSDIPPNESIDPNPSIDVNPDVNLSPADTSTQDNAAGNVEVVTATNTAETSSSPQATNTIEMAASTTETSTSPGETAIFDAILQGEQAQPIDQTSSTPDVDASQLSPPADNTSADNAPPAP